MKSLEDHNKEAMERHRVVFSQDCPNGIECPKCKKELVDVNRSMVLASNPPKYQIRCLECGYYGYRFC